MKDIITLNYSNCHAKVPMKVTKRIVVSPGSGVWWYRSVHIPSHVELCQSPNIRGQNKAPSQPRSWHNWEQHLGWHLGCGSQNWSSWLSHPQKEFYSFSPQKATTPRTKQRWPVPWSPTIWIPTANNSANNFGGTVHRLTFSEWKQTRPNLEQVSDMHICYVKA